MQGVLEWPRKVEHQRQRGHTCNRSDGHLWRPAGARTRSVFEPFGDELLAGMDIDLPERSLADMHELVGRFRRNDDDLPQGALKRRPMTQRAPA